jgi:hypothetical protein
MGVIMEGNKYQKGGNLPAKMVRHPEVEYWTVFLVMQDHTTALCCAAITGG